MTTKTCQSNINSSERFDHYALDYHRSFVVGGLVQCKFVVGDGGEA